MSMLVSRVLTENLGVVGLDLLALKKNKKLTKKFQCLVNSVMRDKKLNKIILPSGRRLNQGRVRSRKVMEGWNHFKEANGQGRVLFGHFSQI